LTDLAAARIEQAERLRARDDQPFSGIDGRVGGCDR